MGNTTPTSGFHRANAGAASAERLAGALDAQAANPGVCDLRTWAHAALAAAPGERAVDVGSGTGSETGVLAAAVAPGGEAVGVEPNAGLRAVAEQRVAEAGGSARFVEGDACALPFEDASVDILWCERVLQHLAEPDGAVAEFARVLRPGGRVALLDTDWATMILHPGPPEVVDVLTARARAAAADPYAGRRLAGRLHAAGLTVTRTAGRSMVQEPTAVAWPVVRMVAEGAVRDGTLAEAARDALYADLAEAAARGDAHMSVTIFAAVARRPL
jgi:SAM-dependent methyltransferase